MTEDQSRPRKIYDLVKNFFWKRDEPVHQISERYGTDIDTVDPECVKCGAPIKELHTLMRQRHYSGEVWEKKYGSFWKWIINGISCTSMNYRKFRAQWEERDRDKDSLAEFYGSRMTQITGEHVKLQRNYQRHRVRSRVQHEKIQKLRGVLKQHGITDPT